MVDIDDMSRNFYRHESCLQRSTGFNMKGRNYMKNKTMSWSDGAENAKMTPEIKGVFYPTQFLTGCVKKTGIPDVCVARGFVDIF